MHISYQKAYNSFNSLEGTARQVIVNACHRMRSMVPMLPYHGDAFVEFQKLSESDFTDLDELTLWPTSYHETAMGIARDFLTPLFITVLPSSRYLAVLTFAELVASQNEWASPFIQQPLAVLLGELPPVEQQQLYLVLKAYEAHGGIRAVQELNPTEYEAFMATIFTRSHHVHRRDIPDIIKLVHARLITYRHHLTVKRMPDMPTDEAFLERVDVYNTALSRTVIRVLENTAAVFNMLHMGQQVAPFGIFNQQMPNCNQRVAPPGTEPPVSNYYDEPTAPSRMSLTERHNCAYDAYVSTLSPAERYQLYKAVVKFTDLPYEKFNELYMTGEGLCDLVFPGTDNTVMKKVLTKFLHISAELNGLPSLNCCSIYEMLKSVHPLFIKWYDPSERIFDYGPSDCVDRSVDAGPLGRAGMTVASSAGLLLNLAKIQVNTAQKAIDEINGILDDTKLVDTIASYDLARRKVTVEMKLETSLGGILADVFVALEKAGWSPTFTTDGILRLEAQAD